MGKRAKAAATVAMKDYVDVRFKAQDIAVGSALRAVEKSDAATTARRTAVLAMLGLAVSVVAVLISMATAAATIVVMLMRHG